ncbi:hypothetical protein BGZ57DRAFT_947028 [Hyaloscypha finlandica]|nr:hypothetical protein BGZ57DRAFT_947028 [Hyaloscypha finlandica]
MFHNYKRGLVQIIHTHTTLQTSSQMDSMDIDSDDYKFYDSESRFLTEELRSRTDNTQPLRPLGSRGQTAVAHEYSPSQPNTVEGTPVLQEFTLFPRLPAELRLRIWAASKPGPRVVEIEFDNRLSFETLSPTSPPSLLAVCRDSRNETLKFYRKLLKPSNNGRWFQTIYFDPHTDILYLPEGVSRIGNFHSVLQDIDPGILVRIQHLALDLSSWEENVSEDEDFRILREFENLQRATIVLASGQDQRGEISFESPYGATFVAYGTKFDTQYRVNLHGDRDLVAQEGRSDDDMVLDQALGLGYGAHRAIRMQSIMAIMNNALERQCFATPNWEFPSLEIKALIRKRRAS